MDKDGLHMDRLSSGLYFEVGGKSRNIGGEKNQQISLWVGKGVKSGQCSGVSWKING